MVWACTEPPPANGVKNAAVENNNAAADVQTNVRIFENIIIKVSLK